jgi:hypothetical protein
VAIQKFSSAAVLHPKPDTYFADIQHVWISERWLAR